MANQQQRQGKQRVDREPGQQASGHGPPDPLPAWYQPESGVPREEEAYEHPPPAQEE